MKIIIFFYLLGLVCSQNNTNNITNTDTNNDTEQLIYVVIIVGIIILGFLNVKISMLIYKFYLPFLFYFLIGRKMMNV